MAASYFDVDGTLVRTSLVHPTLFYLLNQQSVSRVARKLGGLLLDAPRLALAELKDRKNFNEALFAHLEGTSRDRLLLLADECFSKVIRPALFPFAKNLVSDARKQGHSIVLVSGSLDFLLAPLADYLGGAEVIANRLEFQGDYANGKLVPPVVAGPEKARLIREHAEKNGHRLGDCFAYTDSHSDVPMLTVVGHPAVVNPDAKLATVAKTYGWPVLSLT